MQLQERVKIMNETIFKVRDWQKHFENNRSRTVENLRWVCVPNRHDGEGYSILMEQDNAAELFAAWVLILQVASKCQERGTLMREDGTPLTAKSLSVKTRAPETWFSNALNFFTLKVKWLECQETDSQVTPDCQATVTQVTKKEGREWNGREEKEDSFSSSLSSMLESEKLSGEGKFAEALATRIGMTLGQLQASVDSMNLPTGCFETYLRNRAAEDWRTRGNKPIGFSNWLPDLQRFTEAFARNTGPEPKKPTPKQSAPDGWQAVYATIDADPVYADGEYCCPDWDRLAPAERAEVTRRMAAMPSESPQRGFNGSGNVRTAEMQIGAAESKMGATV